MSAEVIAGVASALALGLTIPRRPRLRPEDGTPEPASGTTLGLAWPAAGAAALLVWGVLGGTTGAALGVGVAIPVARAVARAEPPSMRRRREAERRDLPGLVVLIGAALRAGAAPEVAVVQAADALPGPGADRVRRVVARLAWGGDPVETWSRLADDPVLAPLGRALRRAAQTGAPVREVVERLADDLAAAMRADAEDAARSVGVKAALPLGVCFLPAFLLIGIVPLAVGLFGSVTG